jgi:hypothetical protein
MVRAETADRWHWSADVFPPLDFCVRALRQDGLLVAPFDRHPDGDRTLREHDLDAGTWRAWVSAVISAHAGMDALFRAGTAGERPRSDSDRASRERAAGVLRRPSEVCPGSLQLRARLDELWAAYEPEGNRWKREMTLEQSRHQIPPNAQRWLWQSMLPLHDHLETITVFLVDYPQPVVMVVPPTACLIATDPSDLDGWTYARMVLHAAQRLAGAER